MLKMPLLVINIRNDSMIEFFVVFGKFHTKSEHRCSLKTFIIKTRLMHEWHFPTVYSIVCHTLYVRHPTGCAGVAHVDVRRCLHQLHRMILNILDYWKFEKIMFNFKLMLKLKFKLKFKAKYFSKSKISSLRSSKLISVID